MPPCNGADRGCVSRLHHPTRKRADFPLVFRHERPWPTDKGGHADMTAATTPAGAAPDPVPDWHSLNWKKVWYTVRRLQARIVKAVRHRKRW
jgi:hypothetical protein